LLKLAFLTASVITVADPSMFSSSPCPQKLHIALPKNCTMKVVAATLFSVPRIVVCRAALFAEARTGQFCEVGCVLCGAVGANLVISGGDRQTAYGARLRSPPCSK